MNIESKKSKKETAREKLALSQPLLRCPLCGASLALEAGGLCCQIGHRFDLAHSGYVNFASGGDSAHYRKTLFLSRRKLLESGLFSPVLSAIAERIDATDGPKTVLDAGCGEGFYLGEVSRRLPVGSRCFGVDLSRSAIALATDYNADAAFFVADLAKLPFESASFDYILNILSPASYAEFQRVSRRGAKIIKAMPQSGHLAEIRRALGLARSEANGNASDALRLAEAHIEIESRERLTYRYSVSGELAADLFAMTPLAANAKPPTVLIDSVTLDVEVVSGTLK